jgi:hypothetical protein
VVFFREIVRMRFISLSLFTTFTVLLNALYAVNAGDLSDIDHQACSKDIEQPEVYDPLSKLSGHMSKFLADTIFNQAEGSSDPDFISVTSDETSLDFQKIPEDIFTMFAGWGLSDSTVKESETKINEILGSAIMVGRSSRSNDETWKLFSDFISNSTDQIRKAFRGINLNQFSPFGVMYYLENTDEIKNPSWKRRNHRFHKQVSMNSIIELHDAL